jgi:hypothetical protein
MRFSTQGGVGAMNKRRIYHLKSYPSWECNQIKRRILAAVACEQEQLAKIVGSLRVKVEKTARWLPEQVPPDVCFDQLLQRVHCLEAVIAEEITAAAAKEQAIQGILKMVAHIGSRPSPPCPPPHRPPHPDPPPPLPHPGSCPCQWYQICKLSGRCVADMKNSSRRCQA